MIVSLVFNPVVKAPRQSILASLLSLARCAAYTLSQRAAYAPLTLFAEIETPNPVPQTNTPVSYSPLATASATEIAT